KNHKLIPPRRTISESVALLGEDSKATMDADFARDVETGIHSEPLEFLKRGSILSSAGGVDAESQPDDVFEVPGFKMVRRGRYLELKTHRSPEEHRELNRRMRESRPQMLAEIGRKTDELLEIIHKYTSLDFAANLLLREIFHDPDEY